jgi:hypothetical protein
MLAPLLEVDIKCGSVSFRALVHFAPTYVNYNLFDRLGLAKWDLLTNSSRHRHKPPT